MAQGKLIGPVTEAGLNRLLGTEAPPGKDGGSGDGARAAGFATCGARVGTSEPPVYKATLYAMRGPSESDRVPAAREVRLVAVGGGELTPGKDYGAIPSGRTADQPDTGPPDPDAPKIPLWWAVGGGAGGGEGGGCGNVLDVRCVNGHLLVTYCDGDDDDEMPPGGWYYCVAGVGGGQACQQSVTPPAGSMGRFATAAACAAVCNEPPPPPTCPPGQHYSGTACVPNTPPPGGCGSGTTFNPVTNACETDCTVHVSGTYSVTPAGGGSPVSVYFPGRLAAGTATDCVTIHYVAWPGGTPVALDRAVSEPAIGAE